MMDEPVLEGPAAGPDDSGQQRPPEPSRRRHRASAKPSSDAEALVGSSDGPAALGISEIESQMPPRRRGRPKKEEILAREAVEQAKANPTPELIEQARKATARYLASVDKARPRAGEDESRAEKPGEPREPRDKRAEVPASTAPEAGVIGLAPSGDAPSVIVDARIAAAAEDLVRPAADSDAIQAAAVALEAGPGSRRRHHDRWAQNPQQQAGRKFKQGKQPQAQQQGQQQQGQPQGQQQGRRDREQQKAGNQPLSKSARRAARQQQREAALAPKTSMEELEALHTSELRDKAVELGIDPAGLKKPELIEQVYTALVREEGFFHFQGILDIANDGSGSVRLHGYLPSEGDVSVREGIIKANGLRRGDEIRGIACQARPQDKFPVIAKLVSVNGVAPEELRGRPRFADLTPVFPQERLVMEHGRDTILGRCIDLVSPIGKGQRGLIVSPPKAGKTTVLKQIAESIAQNNPEVHLICLLVDERPEEVTDMQRSIRGEVVASTFDMPCDNHITVSELVIERAKRLVELGGDVVILLDSITRLARAYNLAQPASGRILSGGVDSTALYPPKRFLGAARNIEGGGSLTILASALVETGSKMDEVIFEEFKGTGNMELRLDRDLADRRIFPAIDPVASGTRKEELLLDPGAAPFIWGIRRILAGMNNNERAMSMLIKSLKATANNEEFLIRSAKKAQSQEIGVEL